MSETEPALLPCPYCGSAPTTRVYQTELFIECPSASCQVQPWISGREFDITRQAWSTRAPDQSRADLERELAAAKAALAEAEALLNVITDTPPMGIPPKLAAEYTCVRVDALGSENGV